MDLVILPGIYSIYRFAPGTAIPDWINTSDFFSVTGSADELSVVATRCDAVPPGTKANHGWKAIKISGQLDFSLVGIIAEISGILRDSGIPIFVISTFDTDFILVKSEKLEVAIGSLRDKGYNISVQ
jgi:uncharacterized protein